MIKLLLVQIIKTTEKKLRKAGNLLMRNTETKINALDFTHKWIVIKNEILVGEVRIWTSVFIMLIDFITKVVIRIYIFLYSIHTYTKNTRLI